MRTFLAKTAQRSYYPFYLAALTMGMRRGKLLGLRWQDMYLLGEAMGEARITQKFHRLSGRPTFGRRGRAAAASKSLARDC